MAVPQGKARYTYANYLSWNENERIELIEGQPIMQAAPSSEHQTICGEIFRQIANYLDGKNCRVFPAPFAVRLFESHEDTPEDVNTVVEPDITVVCDRTKIDKRGCKGAPDLVIEVLSPSTASHDMIVKLNQYLDARAKEYWVVDPTVKRVQVFLLDNEAYKTANVYTSSDVAKVNVLQGCFVELSKVFSE